WAVPAVEDGSPPADRDAALRTISRTLHADAGTLELLLARIRPLLAAVPDAARLLAPVGDYLLVCPGLADAWDPDRDIQGRPLPPLTTAHLAALRIAGRRLALRTAGLLHQLVTCAGPVAAGALSELDRLIDLWCADYRDGCGARWVPVPRQVEYQSRVVLAAFDLVAHRAEGARSGERGWCPGTAVPMHRE